MSEEITRREFTVQSALAMLSGVVITISACDSDSPTGPSNPPPGGGGSGGGGGVTGSISANHGHSATISAAQLSAGNALTLDIRGEGDHTHTVTLSQGEVMSIAAGQRVTKNSSVNDGHAHTVTFN